MQIEIIAYIHTVDYDEDGMPYVSDVLNNGVEVVDFRELVGLFDEHIFLSCNTDYFGPRDWAETEPDENYRTGERTHASMHLVKPDDAKAARFWVRAMRFSRARQKARDLKARARWAA